jgi:hypothetical protein
MQGCRDDQPEGAFEAGVVLVRILNPGYEFFRGEQAVDGRRAFGIQVADRDPAGSFDRTAQDLLAPFQNQLSKHRMFDGAPRFRRQADLPESGQGMPDDPLNGNRVLCRRLALGSVPFRPLTSARTWTTPCLSGWTTATMPAARATA